MIPIPRFLSGRSGASGDGSVEACLHHLHRGEAAPVNRADDPARTRLPLEAHKVRIRDLRRAGRPPTLEREGFALVHHVSALTDFADAEAVRSIYLPEMEQLLAATVGAERAYALALPVLRAESHERPYGPGLLAEGTARAVHTDYTAGSVRPAAEAAARRHGATVPPGARIAAFTLWRALTPPPQDRPLALLDLATVRDEDLVLGRSYGNAGSPGYEGEFHMLRHRRRHLWGWFPNLEPDEVVIFRQFDTAIAGPSACPHSAFADPTCPAGATPRRSLEVRAFVIGG